MKSADHDHTEPSATKPAVELPHTIELSPAGQLCHLSTGFTTLLGCTASDLLQRDLVELLAPDDRDYCRNGIHSLQSMKTDRVWLRSSLSIAADQPRSRCDLLLVALHDDAGSTNRILLLVSPLQKHPRPPHKQRLKQVFRLQYPSWNLPDEADVVEALLDTIPAPVHFKDLEGRHQLVNHAYSKLVGLPREQIHGRRNSELLPKELAEHCDRSDALTLENGYIEMDESGLDESGDISWWSTHKSLYYDGERWPLGLVGVSLDTTRHKQLERQRLMDLEQQCESEISRVHHRVNNQLQGIVGLIGNTSLKYPEAAEALGEVMGYLKSLAIVERLQGGNDNHSIELEKLVRGIVDNTAPQTHVEWSQQKTPEKLYIAERMEVSLALLLNELLTNAVKHSRATPTESSTIKLSCTAEEESICLQLTNSPAELPVGFDFENHSRQGIGLPLLFSLLPGSLATLNFEQVQREVRVRLTLKVPLLEWK